jgi:uncharacterized repeat protein (TIGR03843 family)
MSSHKRQSSTNALTSLTSGVVHIVGRLPWSSNFTFLVDVVDDETKTRAVYKPEQGEQELWDFPSAIYKREVAAFALSEALGWPNIPPTTIREDAPHGVGSLQLFMPSDFEQHYFTLMEGEEQRTYVDAFMRIATFDIIANNTDRKAGHCLLGDDGEIYAIDNGLCFHEEPKLRTVIWEFQGLQIPELLLVDIERVRNDLPDALHTLLQESEIEALTARMEEILQNPLFPPLLTQRQYPWPIV